MKFHDGTFELLVINIDDYILDAVEVYARASNFFALLEANDTENSLHHFSG